MFKFVPFVVILWQTETKLNQKKTKTHKQENTQSKTATIKFDG